MDADVTGDLSNRAAAVKDESYRLLLVLRRKRTACRTHLSLSRRIGQLNRVSTEAGTVQSTTLYFGPWYRKSPFFEATLRWGCKAYDIYNHMYLPAYYDELAAEYWALVNDVTLWDVGVERVVEISGSDGFELANALTCRDLTKCAVGQGKYAPIIAPDGGIVNDPVLLRREENT